MAKTVYDIAFDFDCEGDPPHVEIWVLKGKRLGPCVIRVHEAPVLKAPEWSWDDEDWEPGPFAKHVLALLNANPVTEREVT